MRISIDSWKQSKAHGYIHTAKDKYCSGSAITEIGICLYYRQEDYTRLTCVVNGFLHMKNIHGKNKFTERGLIRMAANFIRKINNER